MSASILACPLCQQPLQQDDKVLSCASNHCFDQAKQGYWNLLAVQQKKSKDPGDNPSMVEARRNFLELGYYRPLADSIAATLADELASNATAQILDMGCGEGYYTDHWQKSLVQLQLHPDFIGLDISKHAIKAATRRNKTITWLVASGARMPIELASLDVLTVVFSRLMPQPFANVLKTDGLLLLVWPSSKHLLQLKQALYSDLKESQYDPQAELDACFSCQSQALLEFDFQLRDEQHLITLLQMTPHGQRVNQQQQQTIFQTLPINLTFSVNIGLFRKRAAT
ncbi:MAG: methyltransferase domain-containing protein [Pseudomonadales bacterium]|nr:methyltransferase domain-containing protein [Pseudomonadales bacterium]